MKRKLGIVVGIAVLGLAVYLGSQLRAQQPGTPPGTGASPAASGKVALINMYAVMKNYKKFDVYKGEMETLVKKYQGEEADRKKNFEGWRKKVQEAKTDQEKEEALKNMTAWQRAIEDNAKAAQKELAKKDESMIVQMYKEIHEAVGAYAASNSLSAVFSYTEPTTKEEMESSANIQRKLKASGQLGALSPIYIAQGMDISAHVVTMLNNEYQRRAAATAVGNPPGTRQ